MSLKAELETQAAALKAYDEQDLETALEIFQTIADTSKIHTNIGLIYATLGEHEAAVDAFNAATELDKYLAIAYFQCGVSNFLLGRFEYALKDFEEALLYLRGNQNINYEQLGLKFKLHAAEVYFNRGLCYMHLGDPGSGMQDLSEALRNKAIPEHDVVDDAIRDKGEEYTVFSIPVGILFRPSDTKLRNAKTKDYMGKAKLISAADARDEFTAFTGVTRLRQGQLPSGAPLEPTQTSIGSFSARAAEVASARSGLSRAATTAARVQTAAGEKELLNLSVSDRGPGIGRSLTVPAPVTNGASDGGGGSGVTRGLSLRYRGEGTPDIGASGLTRQMTQLNVRDRNEPAPPGALRDDDDGRPSRLTEIYADYLGEDEPSAPLPPNAAERVTQWAKKTTPGTPVPPSRTPSVAVGSSNPTSNDRLRQNIGVPPRRNNTNNGPGSSVGSVRRRVTRRPTTAGSRAPSSYRSTQDRSLYDDEEEEGYVSGEYDDIEYELTKLRIKIHFEDDIRGMTVSPTLTFDDFLDKVCAKFSRSPVNLVVKFADEDGNKVSLIDDSDYDLALEVARDSAKGKPEGKLEMWCMKR